MASELESLFDARRELIAAASHDLRTPVASITAMLEAIEDGLAQPEEYLAPLQEHARRLAALVDDLFELARIDACVALSRAADRVRCAHSSIPASVVSRPSLELEG